MRSRAVQSPGKSSRHVAKIGSYRWTRSWIFVAGIGALILSACGQTSLSSTGSTSTTSAYPTHAITMLVPVPAGSGPDTTARKIAQIASTKLGVPINIENVPAAGGVVDMKQVASAHPNGYSISYASIGTVDLEPLLAKSGFPGPTALTPIAQIDVGSFFVIVKANSSINNLTDLINLAKRSTKKVSIGITTTNSFIDLEAKLLGQDGHVSFNAIPLGQGHQVIGVLNGTVDAAISSTVLAAPYIKSGKLKVIGILGPSTFPGISGTTAKSQGYANLPSAGYELIAGPKGMPINIVTKLESAFQYAVNSSAFKAYCKQTYQAPSYLGSAQLKSELAHDFSGLRASVKKYGL